MSDVAVSGIGEAVGGPQDSLETLIFRSARAALDDAGLAREDLDGVVLAASDQTDGRAISSMLTSGPAGAYLNDEINVASSPGHALALGYMQILSGTHRRLLVSSWGKGSETAGTVQSAERLSAEPFFERDGGTSSLAAAAMQAERHRRGDPERRRAAAQVAARNHGNRSAEDVSASDVVATPLRELELPPETDGAYSVLLSADDDGVILSGVGWCSDGARIAERDLVGLPHLAKAAADAYRRAGLDGAGAIGSLQLHDYTPDAEILTYVPLGLCGPGGELELALSGDGTRPVNPGGGSVRGEAPFGGPLRKLLEAVRAVRAQKTDRALAQMATGFAGQFQTVAIVEGRS
jgi:acetyl-CoA C-acetyltransferase